MISVSQMGHAENGCSVDPHVINKQPVYDRNKVFCNMDKITTTKLIIIRFSLLIKN